MGWDVEGWEEEGEGSRGYGGDVIGERWGGWRLEKSSKTYLMGE